IKMCEEIFLKVEKKYPDIPDYKKKYQIISSLIGLLIADVVNTSLEALAVQGIETYRDVKEANAILISYSPRLEKETLRLKDFLQKNVYEHYKVERMRIKAERYVTLLFETYSANPTLLPQKYRDRIGEEQQERVICDYIAGMTDRYALDEYKKLFEPYERV
ncbi:MAG: deoxyguanosinetriphosphate triphosphohydrolase, partial [Thermodesulfobacteriota bacterium]|nr:deoxyguanosinetriphosphate triphosphohydrolase [Thermodesulfobacteriota bacterium]